MPAQLRPFHTFSIHPSMHHRGTHLSLTHTGGLVLQPTDLDISFGKHRNSEALSQVRPHSLVARRRLCKSARWLHPTHSEQPPRCSGSLCTLSQSLFINHYKADEPMTFRLHEDLITRLRFLLISLVEFGVCPNDHIFLGEPVFFLFWLLLFQRYCNI